MSDSQQAQNKAEPINQDESLVLNNAAIDIQESNTTSKNDEKLALYEPEYADDEDRTVVQDMPADPYNNEDYANENLDNLKTAGAILRYHRLRSGYTIQEVASAIRARAGTVYDIENDRLNNSSCICFAKAFIMNYATLMKLDPNQMFELYLRNISENVSIDHEQSEQKVDKQMARNWILVVIMILVAASGYFVFSGGSDSSKTADNQGTLSSPQATNVNISEPLVTSEMQIGQDNNTVVIEDPNNKDAPEVKVVSPNTVKATAQAQALAANNSDSEVTNEDAHEQPNSLVLPADAKNNAQIESIRPSSSILADKVETKAMALNEQAKRESNKNINIAPSDTNIQESVAVNTHEVKHNPQAPTIKQDNVDAKKVSDEPKQPIAQDKNSETIELKDKLKDISSKVKLVDREGLASLNSAEVEVVKKVALKIIDSQKKVLASGVYEAPKTIKVIGIPPIVVELSDTQAVKISYQGGKVVMPKDKQVKLELPMR